MIKKKVMNISAALAVLFALACTTSSVGIAPTVKGKYYQSRLDYAQLLVIANEYKATPTADPGVVKTMQDTDLKVQAVEEQINQFIIEGNFTEATAKIDLFVLFVNELRHQLITRGLIKLEVK